jgi:hypothetical protein
MRRETVQSVTFSKLGTLAGLALFARSNPSRADGTDGEECSARRWVWVQIVAVLLALLLWWWLRRLREEAAPTAKPVIKASPAPDDLKRIEGIGPKISELLQSSGITTFAQLAAAEVGRLREVLKEAGLAGLADPATWPEQADLAAAGKWEALEALQGELKGGRRV